MSRQSDAWFASDEARRLTANILSHQTARGDWPKNIDTTATVQSEDSSKIQGTFDNGATVGELRFLARSHRVTHDPVVAEAVLRGLRHILAAQYPTGGWPQSYPPGKGYARHITFNDGTMVNLMELMRDVVRSETFDWVSTSTKQEAQAAFDRAIASVLNCQIRVNGALTVWCAQHDATTLEPRPARTYELISLSGSESAGILRFLMTIEKPTPAIAGAIRAGAAWFAAVPQKGIRWEDRAGDRVVIEDPGSPWLWARFYEIGTNRPIFSGRDGVMKYAVSDIEHERRTGYAWYGQWGHDVARDFSAWTARQSPR
ncbi:MAG: pectate lyase [Verrucomicrobiales bacterium]|nr:pectate lyase [Verrucomicrobiales bacterium]